MMQEASAHPSASRDSSQPASFGLFVRFGLHSLIRRLKVCGSNNSFAHRWQTGGKLSLSCQQLEQAGGEPGGMKGYSFFSTYLVMPPG